jgi:hypothetical protein
VNVEGTRVVVDAAIQAGCEHFLYMSTIAAYALADCAVVDELTPLLKEGARLPAEQSKGRRGSLDREPPRSACYGSPSIEHLGSASHIDVVGTPRSAHAQGRVCSRR